MSLKLRPVMNCVFYTFYIYDILNILSKIVLCINRLCTKTLVSNFSLIDFSLFFMYKKKIIEIYFYLELKYLRIMFKNSIQINILIIKIKYFTYPLWHYIYFLILCHKVQNILLMYLHCGNVKKH